MERQATRTVALVFLGLIFVSSVTQPVVAQSGDDSGSDGSALGDVIIDAIRGLLHALFNPVETIQNLGDALAGLVIGTPHPDSVFSKPTNNAWPNIYSYYWNTIIPLSLSLYGLSIGLVIFFESTSHLFSGYHRSKLKKRAFAGLLGILAWWWIAALSLQFIDALAGFLAPNLANISWFQTLSFGTIGLLGLVLSWAADLLLFLLIGLIYIVRRHVLFLYVLLMPLLIVFWIPGVGPFALASKFMKKLASFYVPFLFMTVPVALLFRLGDLLGTSAGPSLGGIGVWLSAIVIPFLAVVAPLILFWQAGALFFIGDRIAHHVSAQRAKHRATKTKQLADSGRQGGRNFMRGIRDEPAVTKSGQMVFGSGDSRAHAVGSRVNAAGSRLGDSLKDGNFGGGGGGRGGSGGDVDGSSTGDSNTGGSNSGGDQSSNSGGESSRESSDRNTSHDNTRSPPRGSENRESTDDEPRYIY